MERSSALVYAASTQEHVDEWIWKLPAGAVSVVLVDGLVIRPLIYKGSSGDVNGAMDYFSIFRGDPEELLCCKGKERGVLRDIPSS